MQSWAGMMMNLECLQCTVEFASVILHLSGHSLTMKNQNSSANIHIYVCIQPSYRTIVNGMVCIHPCSTPQSTRGQRYNFVFMVKKPLAVYKSNYAVSIHSLEITSKDFQLMEPSHSVLDWMEWLMLQQIRNETSKIEQRQIGKPERDTCQHSTRKTLPVAQYKSSSVPDFNKWGTKPFCQYSK